MTLLAALTSSGIWTMHAIWLASRPISIGRARRWWYYILQFMSQLFAPMSHSLSSLFGVLLNVVRGMSQLVYIRMKRRRQLISFTSSVEVLDNFNFDLNSVKLDNEIEGLDKTGAHIFTDTSTSFDDFMRPFLPLTNSLFFFRRRTAWHCSAKRDKKEITAFDRSPNGRMSQLYIELQAMSIYGYESDWQLEHALRCLVLPTVTDSHIIRSFVS